MTKTLEQPTDNSGRPPGTDAPAVRLTVRQSKVVFGTILLGMLLAALDQTIVSTALPTIVGDLGGASHVSWLIAWRAVQGSAPDPSR